MQFHACAAGVSENGIDAFAFEGGDDDHVTLRERKGLRRFGEGVQFHVSGALGHNLFCSWSARLWDNKKTHDRCQPWVLVDIRSSATSPGGAYSDDDENYDLQRPKIHAAWKLKAGPAQVKR
jgi:hypothetical protein